MSGIINSIGSRSGIIGSTTIRPSSFMAGFTSAAWLENISSGTKVYFNSVTVNQCFNEGGNFDTTNNRYVAPAHGVYSFTVQVYTGKDQQLSNFQFRIINSPVSAYENLYMNHGTPFYTGDSGDVVDTSPNYTAILKLLRTQYVEVFTSGASDYYTGHTVFFGARLS